MKYEIFINGGFANIPKQFQGEITLKDSEKEALFESLVEKPKPSHEIHDGFIYHISIIEEDKDIKSVYDEHNLPEVVRKFIHSVLPEKE